MIAGSMSWLVVIVDYFAQTIALAAWLPACVAARLGCQAWLSGLLLPYEMPL